MLTVAKYPVSCKAPKLANAWKTSGTLSRITPSFRSAVVFGRTVSVKLIQQAHRANSVLNFVSSMILSQGYRIEVLEPSSQQTIFMKRWRQKWSPLVRFLVRSTNGSSLWVRMELWRGGFDNAFVDSYS